MNLAVFASGSTAFANSTCIRGFAFNSAVSGVNYALLPVICAGFALSGAKYALLSRVECLLPQSSMA